MMKREANTQTSKHFSKVSTQHPDLSRLSHYALNPVSKFSKVVLFPMVRDLKCNRNHTTVSALYQSGLPFDEHS